MIKPPFAFAGHKLKLMDKILPIIMATMKKFNYSFFFEPFFGSGTVMINLLNYLDTHEEVTHSIESFSASEINPRICQIHRDIKEKPEEFLQDIRTYYSSINSKEDYKAFITESNNNPPNGARSFIMHHFAFFGRVHYDKDYHFSSSFHMPSKDNEKKKLNFEELETRTRRISHLYNKYNVIIFNNSYDEMEKPSDTLLYIDPPYAGTSGYSTIRFDFDAFDDWLDEHNDYIISTFKHYYIPKPSINYKVIVPKTITAKTGKMGAKRMEFLRVVHPSIVKGCEIEDIKNIEEHLYLMMQK